MIDTSKIYTSNNYGKFKVLECINSRNILIEFISTKYKTNVCLSSIKKGSVKDKYTPTVCGVGFIGNGKYKSTKKSKKTKQYSTWKCMMQRCYDHKYHNKYPTYKGCIVCDEWHNFQVFAEWFDKNYINGFELDKDIKVNNNKVYSSEFCKFVSHKDNTIKASARIYKFISPQNELVDIYNLNRFCIKNNLNNSSMSAVQLGKRNHHKGWAKP